MEKEAESEKEDTVEKTNIPEPTVVPDGGKENAAVVTEGTEESGRFRVEKKSGIRGQHKMEEHIRLSVSNQTAKGGELPASLFDGEETELKYTNVGRRRTKLHNDRSAVRGKYFLLYPVGSQKCEILSLHCCS